LFVFLRRREVEPWLSRAGIFLRGAVGACGRLRGEKPGITHRIVAIDFGLGVLLALSFNRDGFLCAFSWVHNDCRLSAGDVLLGGSSIILTSAL
jgi:hypothetical protein